MFLNKKSSSNPPMDIEGRVQMKAQKTWFEEYNEFSRTSISFKKMCQVLGLNLIYCYLFPREKNEDVWAWVASLYVFFRKHTYHLVQKGIVFSCRPDSLFITISLLCFHYWDNSFDLNPTKSPRNLLFKFIEK